MKNSVFRCPILCAALASATSILLTAPKSAQAQTFVYGPQNFGVYRGAGSSYTATSPTTKVLTQDKGLPGIDSFEKWFGVNPNARAIDFFPSDTWANMTGAAAGGTWMIDPWAWYTVPGTTRKYSPTWGIPMLPSQKIANTNEFVYKIEDGAKGNYTGGLNGTEAGKPNYWKTIATNLKNGLHPTAANPVIIRLGAEFNMHTDDNSNPDELTPTNYLDWINYWQRIVTEVRKVMPNGEVLFDWNLIPGASRVTDPATNKKFLIRKGYPTDAFVDIIGMDAYNAAWNKNLGDPQYGVIADPYVRWTWIYGVGNTAATGPGETGTATQQSQGIAYWIQFAKEHGKPISFPEWGTGKRPNDNNAGGDDPYYIQKMHETMVANAGILRYHNYWDYQAGDFECRLSDDHQPLAGRKFRELFQEFYSIRDTEVLDAVTGTTVSGGAIPQHKVTNPKENGFNGGQVFTGTATTADFSGGQGTYLDAQKVGDWVEYKVPNVKAGTYTIWVRVKQNSSKGWFILKCGDYGNYNATKVGVGGITDTYITDPTGTLITKRVGTVTFSTTGDKVFHFESAGKLSSSGSYQLCFDYISFVPG